MTVLAVFVVLLLGLALISHRLARTPLTAPMLFTAAGLVLAGFGPTVERNPATFQAFLRVAELGLVLLLFTDASRTDLQALNSIRNLPTRLLTAGLLLTLLLGAVLAMVVFTDLSWWEAGIVAAILAPTDAGLGQVIVTSPKVPARIRQALNVEAGLNDGLAVPFLMLFMALAAASADAQAPRLSTVIFQQLGIGSAIGIGVGLLGGYLLGMARRLGLMAREFEMLGVVTLPVLCLLASEALGASMFIAAFVAGLAVQIGFREAGEHAVEFTDSFGQVLNLAVFFLFGMLAFHRVGEFGPRVWLYAALSLTVIRMVPVAVALWGTGLDRATVLFMGWFGPRGLASIVLGLVYLEHHEFGAHPTIRLAVVATVLLSIFAHGATALPGIAWYARRS